MATRDAPGQAAGWGQLPPGQQEGAELPPSSFGGTGIPRPPEGKLGLSQEAGGGVRCTPEAGGGGVAEGRSWDEVRGGGGQRGGESRRGAVCAPWKCSLRPGSLALQSSDPLFPWGRRRTGQALPLASHSRECQAHHQPTPVNSITLPVTQAERTRLLS